MKRICVVVAILLAAVAVAQTVQAATYPRYGVGYFRSAAPLGGRVWLSEVLGLDLGIGFDSRKISGGQDEEKTKLAFRVDAGVPYVLIGDESAKLFLRPGLAYESEPHYNTVDEFYSSTALMISGTLGVEYFLVKSVSLQAAHGIVFRRFDPGTENSDAQTNFGSESFGISDVGFHFYFD